MHVRPSLYQDNNRIVTFAWIPHIRPVICTIPKNVRHGHHIAKTVVYIVFCLPTKSILVEQHNFFQSVPTSVLDLEAIKENINTKLFCLINSTNIKLYI